MEREWIDEHHRGEGNRDRYFKTRNILNIVFMLGVVVGMLIYFLSSRETGTIVILVSMLFKVAECCLRFIR